MAAERLVYAVDIGDSVIRAGLFRNGRTFLFHTVETPQDHPANDALHSLLWPVVGQLVREMQEQFPGGLGLALSASGTMTLQRSPGARNYGPFQDHEVMVTAPNVAGLANTPVLACVERLGLGLPIHIENDMNAAITSATQFEDAVLIGLGAGLGGAIKKSGRVEHLPGTWSCFEIGHGRRWVISSHYNRRCHCGTVGCLEAAIGGWAMTERYVSPPEFAQVEVYERMRGDVIALLPQAIARLVNASQIPTVLMGGKGSLGYALGSDFIAQLQTATQRLVPDMTVAIQLLDLGEVAELHGSSLAFLEHVELAAGALSFQNS